MDSKTRIEAIKGRHKASSQGQWRYIEKCAHPCFAGVDGPDPAIRVNVRCAPGAFGMKDASQAVADLKFIAHAGGTDGDVAFLLEDNEKLRKAIREFRNIMTDGPDASDAEMAWNLLGDAVKDTLSDSHAKTQATRIAELEELARMQRDCLRALHPYLSRYVVRLAELYDQCVAEAKRLGVSNA